MINSSVSMNAVNELDVKNQQDLEKEMTINPYYGCLPVHQVQGADTSQWQAKTSDPRIPIDFGMMKSKGVQYVFIRCTIKGNNDVEFTRSWEGAKKAGLLRGAYIALDYRANIQSQVQKSVFRLGDDPGELPVAVDFEKLLYTGLGPTKALERLKIAVDDLDSKYGRKCIIYTNPDAINNFINWLPGWFLQHDLWVAHYGVDTFGPEVGYQYFTKAGLPKGGFRFWQYTDRGNGIAYGCQSKQIDLDWWNGTREELLAYAGAPMDPPKPKTLEQQVADHEVRITALERK